MPQPELLHPEAADILEPLILLAHSLGIFVNLLLGNLVLLLLYTFAFIIKLSVFHSKVPIFNQ